MKVRKLIYVYCVQSGAVHRPSANEDGICCRSVGSSAENWLRSKMERPRDVYGQTDHCFISEKEESWLFSHPSARAFTEGVLAWEREEAEMMARARLFHMLRMFLAAVGSEDAAAITTQGGPKFCAHFKNSGKQKDKPFLLYAAENSRPYHFFSDERWMFRGKEMSTRFFVRVSPMIVQFAPEKKFHFAETGEALIGTRVYRKFADTPYEGRVVAYKPPVADDPRDLYSIKYDEDSDREDMDIDELQKFHCDWRRVQPICIDMETNDANVFIKRAVVRISSVATILRSESGGSEVKGISDDGMRAIRRRYGYDHVSRCDEKGESGDVFDDIVFQCPYLDTSEEMVASESRRLALEYFRQQTANLRSYQGGKNLSANTVISTKSDEVAGVHAIEWTYQNDPSSSPIVVRTTFSADTIGCCKASCI